MALEKYLVVRPDGQVEKSKSVDKIDSRATSFFAATPTTSPSKGFTVLGGYAVIFKSFISKEETSITLGIGGSHQTQPIPIGYWNTSAFSLDQNGDIVKTEGTPASTKGAVVAPEFPFGNLPICLVTYKDNGSGAAGTILDLDPLDIVDRRPFFYGSYNQAVDYTDAISDFKVDQTFPVTTDLIVRSGHIYFVDGHLVEFPETTVSLGVGGTYQAPSSPINQYRMGLISLTRYSTIDIQWSEPEADANDLVRPAVPRGVIPLAAVTVQDNGSGIAGSILPVSQTAISDARPSTTNMLGVVRADDLNYVKVEAMFPADKRVRINAGVIYPSAGLFVDYNTTLIDFGSGINQLTALTSGYWKRILISLDAAGNTLFFYSPESSTRGALANPIIPKNVIPLAFVDVQDDSSGIAGSIRPIENKYIKDIRPWLGSTGSGAGGVTSASSIYSDYLNTSSWEQGFYEDFQEDDMIDLPNTTGEVDILVDNNCVLAPGEVIQSINIFDSYAGLLTVARALPIVDSDDNASLTIELTNDGGLTWLTVLEKGVLDFTTSGTDLRIRITNSGSSDVSISNYGVFYNDDEISPSFIFSNERLPLFQTIYDTDPEVSGTTVTLKNSRSYPIGEDSLLVFKDGSLLLKDPTLSTPNSYRELSMTQVQLATALSSGERLDLVMPAGYFGQTVAQFQSTINTLVAAKNIVDGLVRTPSEGTSPDLQTSINNDLQIGIGGSILLESQTHTITSTVTISNKPTYIYTKGRKAVLQVAPTYASPIITVSDNSEFQLSGVSVRASAYAASATGLNFSGSSPDIVISNAVFENLSVAINIASGCHRLLIKDSKFLNCGKVIDGSADNIQMFNCEVDGLTVGTEAIQAGSRCVFSDNQIKNYSSFAISLSGEASLRGNVVSDCAVGIEVGVGADETVVDGNKVSSCTSGIEVSANNCVIKGNVCKSNDTGIVINGSENMIESNVVTDNSSDGIVIGASATGNEIGNNVLTRNP